jgi:hypothetical protein
MRMNEVGCERLFSIAGYVSNPRQTQLKVKHYKAMAMLKQNMQQIYISEDWVVEQYQHMEKTKGWELMETQNDQLVRDLKAELYAEDIGVPVEALQLEDLEELETPVAAAANAINVHNSSDSSTTSNEAEG